MVRAVARCSSSQELVEDSTNAAADVASTAAVIVSTATDREDEEEEEEEVGATKREAQDAEGAKLLFATGLFSLDFPTEVRMILLMVEKYGFRS